MRTLLAFLFLLLAMTTLPAQNPPAMNVMPLPANVEFGTGQLPIDSTFSVSITGAAEPRLKAAASRMINTLAAETGLRLGDKPSTSVTATLVVHADHASNEIQTVDEDESYELTVTPSGAKLNAPNSLGVLRGLQTFLQLVELTPNNFSVPAVTIHDQPRFRWRGLLIDVSRHWMPVAVIKRNLDGMEAVKLNVLHLHFSDDQGFRVESKKLPKLQDVGSEGHYYTQEEVKDIIAYARDRGIRIMPEFEMPGHSTALLTAYPEIGTSPGPYEVGKDFGEFDGTIDPTKEVTYKTLDTLIGEMASLFPDAYFHIGGDEVNGKAWNASPQIQAFMRSHGMKNNEELQAYFNKRLQEIVAKHHKIMVGWDEILTPDLPKSIVIQSWRGPDSLASAAHLGYQSLLSYGYYLDLYQSAEFHYLNEPISGKALNLTPEEMKMILGGEACMWGELVTPENIDSRIWPRMAAIAERFWSPQQTRDVPSMYTRMQAESLRLQWVGLQHLSYYEPMLERLVGSSDIEAIKRLADVVQAPPEYERGDLHAKITGRAYRTLEPMNRLVDASQPESILAVEFNTMVDDFLAHKATPEEIAQIRELLSEWRDNDAKLRPQMQPSFLLKEAAPLSENLSALGATGLLAMEYLENGTKPAPDWMNQRLLAIAGAKQPQAELLLAVAPAVEKLVRAAAQ